MRKFPRITELKKLRMTANTIRQEIIKMLVGARSGHTAGPLGLAEVFTALYFNVIYHDPKNPKWEERDRVVLSNGHVCPVLYATLAQCGYFPIDELATLRKLGSRLQGHPHRQSLPGIETSSGPLGQGLSQAVGMAIAGKNDRKRWRVYAILSDGEHDEGATWEAVMLASKYRLGNLVVTVDRNNIQIDGMTEKVMPLEPFADKYKAFGWHVIDVDGHNVKKLIDAYEEAKAIYEKPTVIIAHTIPGKPIPFMEFDHQWHGKPPNEKEAKEALEVLESEREMIEEDEH